MAIVIRFWQRLLAPPRIAGDQVQDAGLRRVQLELRDPGGVPRRRVGSELGQQERDAALARRKGSGDEAEGYPYKKVL